MDDYLHSALHFLCLGGRNYNCAVWMIKLNPPAETKRAAAGVVG